MCRFVVGSHERSAQLGSTPGFDTAISPCFFEVFPLDKTCLLSVPIYDRTPNSVFAWRRVKLLGSCPILLSVSRGKPVQTTGSSHQGEVVLSGVGISKAV